MLKEADYFSIKYDDAAAYEAVLSKAKTELSLSFCQIMRYNTDFNLQTFVLNFVTPQQNPMGRLQQRYYLGNLVYFCGLGEAGSRAPRAGAGEGNGGDLRPARPAKARSEVAVRTLWDPAMSGWKAGAARTARG